jgi:ubiquinone/menaquinone biosynthesis C-methylase UbiE
LRTEICYRISRSLIKPPSGKASDPAVYSAWRGEEMRASWQRFSDTDIDGKDVLDFGCGDGPLSLYLAREKRPKSILGVDIDPVAIERANEALELTRGSHPIDDVRFLLGSTSGLPSTDESADTILAFDCMEHVMDPEAILADWHRVLRPGGKVLIEWYPFKGPYGPHMSGLVPIPWAHVLFGERALFEAAARLYDDPEYVPNQWDLDECGNKLPNKWAKANTFREQSYLNELDIPTFNRMVSAAGFRVVRQERRSFGQSGVKHAIGKMLLKLPMVDEYFVNFVLIELQK